MKLTKKETDLLLNLLIIKKVSLKHKLNTYTNTILLEICQEDYKNIENIYNKIIKNENF